MRGLPQAEIDRRIDHITKRQAEGASGTETARELGMTSSGLHHFIRREGLPQWRDLGDPAHLRSYGKPVGMMALRKSLTRDQMLTLADMADKWGCETLAEAALEILRDKLEEEMT